jgi:hypothetical protein
MTICKRGWTSTVRPPESVTEPEKVASMAAYGDRGSLSGYEYDHFVPLELGGATNDPRNLWPEPGSSPNPKDAVEDQLNRQVCARQMTLVQAQRAIATNWVSLARAKKPKPKAPSTPAATCSATAQYSSRYNDYDVYVHSNQPDQTVTVTGPCSTRAVSGPVEATAAGRRVRFRRESRWRARRPKPPPVRAAA